MNASEIVDALQQDNNLDAEKKFKSVMQQKIGDALDLKRVEVATQLVTNHVPEVEGADEEGV